MNQIGKLITNPSNLFAGRGKVTTNLGSYLTQAGSMREAQNDLINWGFFGAEQGFHGIVGGHASHSGIEKGVK